MKRFSYYSCILLLWTTASISNALADFSVIDSDGDVYHVGAFLGHEMDNQKYYVQYINSSSFSPTAEGFLYFDEFYQSMKIVVFENDEIHGFTIEGYWQGSGSEIYFVNSGGNSGVMDLFLGEALPRKRTEKKSVKQVLK
jgi:hypothetical protein